MLSHGWQSAICNVTFVEEHCVRCGLRRWRAPGASAWNYGRGDGQWERMGVEPLCCPSVKSDGRGTGEEELG